MLSSVFSLPFDCAGANISGQLKITRSVAVPDPNKPAVPKNIITIPAEATHVFVPFASGIAEAVHKVEARPKEKHKSHGHDEDSGKVKKSKKKKTHAEE